MADTYVIQAGDTLQKIAQQFYGDPSLYKKLADYDGILNPDLIRINQTIEIPSRSELEGVITQPPAPAPGLTPPNGLQGILNTFGNIFAYIGQDGSLDPRWVTDQLARAPLPFPIPLSWDPSKGVTNFYCHVKLVDVFPRVFAAIQQQGLKHRIKTFGGCFNFRSKRTSGKLSTHSWGIAIDLNPDSNP